MDIKISTFRKVLVANRGEIAIRIIRALSELGIGSISVYSKEDRYAPFRSKADESYPLDPEKGPVDAYMDIPTIIRIAKERKADAIHPGYGFLSENPLFAEECRKNNIVFIGPNVESMNIMGDKISAKKAAAESRVPIISGSESAIYTVEEAVEIADEIGYPIMLKAANGGGGRGMRIVEKREDLGIAFAQAENESKRAFGEAKLFIEKYLHHPKHIEVQILGDNYGNIVHLYDRDCSVQRRNQKVIEFAPAWCIDDDVRKKILDSAKRLARRVGYTNVGTMEFLVDEDQNPYFIEMNPRIQVEHTVSEAITGIDIATVQILVAQGYPLNSPAIHIYSQNDIKCHGFSIQCRVSTEDPQNQFIPDSGKVDLYRPATGNGIRLDGGNAFTGAVITPHYDSLLVKVVSHDRTFLGAINKSVRALKEFRIHGIKNNISFLINLLNHEVFRSGKAYTTFIEETPDLVEQRFNLDRTTKLLEFLANKMVNVNPGEKPYLENRKVPVIDPDIKIRGTRDEFLRMGAKEFTQKIYRSKKLYITDTTMRDAQQSLLNTRMRTKEVAGAARATNLYLKNSFSIEAWGGTTYDTAYRFLKESPWRRLDILRERMPNVLIQALIRGSNVVGYSAYPDNVVEKFIKVSSDHGVDVYRIFDAMNSIDNMKVAIAAALKTGKIVEGTVCYSGDCLDSSETKYTIDYYVNKALELEALGCHIICIKDMTGVLKPYAAKQLITALKEALHVPIHLHTHDTAGTGIATYLMAAEAGVDIVDCAISSMSSQSSQPSMNTLVKILQDTDRDTGIDLEGLSVLSDYYRHERKVYQVFEDDVVAPETAIYKYEIPGAQYATFKMQAKSMGAGNNIKELMELYRQADELLGHIIKVTPCSKVVGDLALFMLANHLTKDNILTAGANLSYPDSVVEYFLGLLGQPEDGFPEELQKIILKDKKPYTQRPGLFLEPENFEWIDQHLKEHYWMDSMKKPEVMEQKVLSYALYPKVYSDYCEHFESYNDVSKLESHVYFYGLRQGEETSFRIDDGNDVLIKFIRKSEPDQKGYRTLQFEVNGFYREIKILDRNFEIKADRRLMVDHKNPGHLGASMPGVICDIIVHEGEHVQKNQQIMTIEAMKMETKITSPISGIVDKIYVANGDEVKQDNLLISFICDEDTEIVHPELPEMDLAELEQDEFKTVPML